MKKITFLSILIWLFFVSFSFGQNNETQPKETVTKEISLSMGELSSSEINDIRWKFCSDSEWNVKATLRTTLRPNQLKKLCFVLWNDAEQNYEIESQIVPTSLDSNNNIVCKAALETWDQEIIDSIMIDEIKELTLTGKSHIVKNIAIKPPKNYSGELSFCLSYKIVNLEDKYAGGWMFKIISVKSNKWFIDVQWSNYPEIFNIAKNNKNFRYAIMWIISVLMIYFIAITIKEENNKKHNKTKNTHHKK